MRTFAVVIMQDGLCDLVPTTIIIRHLRVALLVVHAAITEFQFMIKII